MTIEIGTKFIKQRGKRTNKERVETVTDILKTYNSAGEHIKTRYVASINFAGKL
jgi:predicted transcriptional regulator